MDLTCQCPEEPKRGSKNSAGDGQETLTDVSYHFLIFGFRRKPAIKGIAENDERLQCDENVLYSSIPL